MDRNIDVPESSARLSGCPVHPQPVADTSPFYKKSSISSDNMPQDNEPKRQDAETQAAVRAAEEIFARHDEFIRKVIHFELTDKSKADDIYQDLFLSLIKSPIGDDVKNVESYLYKAICNDIIDAARRTGNYRRHIHKFRSFSKNSIYNNGPEDAVINIDEFESITKLADQKLPERQAKALKMRYEQEKTIGQIAEKMDVDKRTVSTYLSAALKKLKNILNRG